MTYTPEQLRDILDAHAKWLRSDAGGRGADLSGANLSRANLSGANLSRANLSRENLSRANLSGTDLYGANLSGADLYGANLCEANLSGTSLIGADLSGADLSGADLSRADLSRADLSGADLIGADLSGADLSGADLSRADLIGATWEKYTTEILPALLRAGVLPLEELLTESHWNCQSWENCPMAAAFGVHSIEKVPPIHRLEASRFIELFDAQALPLDKVREWCGLQAEHDAKGGAV